MISSISPASPPKESDWLVEQVRLLDPVDSTSSSLDIIAAYARLTEYDLEIRLDLLQIQDPWAFDIQLKIDMDSGGLLDLPNDDASDLDWDWLISAPAELPPAMINYYNQEQSSFLPRILRDEKMDAVTIQLNREALGSNISNARFQAWLYEAGTSISVDHTGIFSLNQSISSPVPLLLAFWDSLPAVTAQQVLRRWDGAHAGPYGQRHGLKHLLQASDQYHIPIALMDLKIPESLAGLELVGGLDMVISLERKGILILPDATNGDTFQPGIAQNYGLLPSSFIHGVDISPGDSHTYIFSVLPSKDHILEFNSRRWIPLPDENLVKDDVCRNGLTSSFIQSLLEIALSDDPTDLTTLGGSLPTSPLADHSIAYEVFSYIHNHPWIRVLDSESLQTFPVVTVNEIPVRKIIDNDYTQLSDRILSSLASLPDSAITRHAWMAYSKLSRSTSDNRLMELQSGYMGQIGYLTTAGEWAVNPQSIQDCSRDLDWDEQPECILASETIFSILDPSGGQLSLLINRNKNNISLIIEPSSLLAIGTNDSTSWVVQNGRLTDPDEITGAFSDGEESIYQTLIGVNQITFTSPDGSTSKKYQLVPAGIHIDIQSTHPIRTQIPLVVAPEVMFSPGWVKHYLLTGNPSNESWSWGLFPSPRVSVKTKPSCSVSIVNSIINSESLRKPEDPNAEREPGWLLPIPLLLYKIESDNPLSVDIIIK